LPELREYTCSCLLSRQVMKPEAQAKSDAGSSLALQALRR
jgi:hypothetical protein